HVNRAGRPEIQVVQVRLTIRHRERNPVHEYAYAAHAECRTRTEAADHDAAAEREVLSVVDDEPGHASERLVQAYGRPRVLNRATSHLRQRYRRARRADTGARDRHLQRIERN